MGCPCETRTSTCRSFATISSGLYRFLAITVLLDVKDIPQVGPLQWGRIIIASIGNAAENVLWPLVGRMPTDWITRTDATLLSTPQVDLLEKKLESRFGITQ